MKFLILFFAVSYLYMYILLIFLMVEVVLFALVIGYLGMSASCKLLVLEGGEW